MIENQTALSRGAAALAKRIQHSNRTRCNLAHYLQKDFAAAVKADILIDDVQRAALFTKSPSKRRAGI